MRVYRIENKNGRGPYNGRGDLPYTVLDGCPAHQPDPRDDGFGSRWNKPDYYFGFASLDQLFDWFGDILEHLDRYGFSLTVWEVDESFVELGGRQLAFNKSEATLIERRQPTELLELI
jgi:hypothetical protein